MKLQLAASGRMPLAFEEGRFDDGLVDALFVLWQRHEHTEFTADGFGLALENGASRDEDFSLREVPVELRLNPATPRKLGLAGLPLRGSGEWRFAR